MYDIDVFTNCIIVFLVMAQQTLKRQFEDLNPNNGMFNVFILVAKINLKFSLDD